MLFNGNEITAKLVKIDSNKVSYSENGTMKSINKNEVFRIILQNGEKLLIKKETIYLPIVYEDMIIYTDGSDMKVNIVSLENETITYQYDNTLKTTHPTLVQFVKYKDGRTIKGIDLIKYEDKVIMNTGDEYNSVKYKDMNNTHVVIQEKGKQTLTELPITDVFVVKLHTGEKKFPPKSIIPATNSKKDTVVKIENPNNVKKTLPIEDKKLTPQKKTIQPKAKDTTSNTIKRDYLYMKTGEIIEGEIISHLKNRLLFLNHKTNDKEEYYLEDIQKYEVNIIHYE